MDRLAAELGLEPAELRARNLVGPDEMPYATGLVDRSGKPQSYDSGDFPELLRRAVAKADLEGVRARQREGARDGRLVGVGFAMYIEATGLGPFETARIDIAPSGRVKLAIGAPSQGQGHRTSMAQIAADAIGVPFDAVDVVGGDTSATPFGVGTIASRALVNAGNATHRAGRLVREKIIEAAARRLGVPADGLDLREGVITPKDAGKPALTLAELAGRAPLPGTPEPTDGRHGTELSETVHFRPPGFAVSSGAHAAVVEVDEHTGETEILHYVAVHDAGVIVNPMIAEGQVTGGIAQGIGGALYEEMIYGPDGQPRTGTYMDYLVPTSSEIPDLDLDEIHSPSPMNDLGVKGLGEGGAIAPQAVLANAVEDALRPFGVVVRRGPSRPAAYATCSARPAGPRPPADPAPPPPDDWTPTHATRPLLHRPGRARRRVETLPRPRPCGSLHAGRRARHPRRRRVHRTRQGEGRRGADELPRRGHRDPRRERPLDGPRPQRQ